VHVSVVAQYLDDVLRRAPMSPDGFEPDWADHPWQHKVYAGAPRFALPAPSWQRAGSLGSALFDEPADGPQRWTVDLLSTMLQYSYGLLGRRLRITGNPQQHGQIPYPSAVWARGSAAGGGLYPCEIYWVRGASGPGLPGIYHYSAPHHAMNRIALGDATHQVREAVADTSADADQYLLVTVKLWKNSFKYADFCYHCVTMDLGCLLATWHSIAAANGVELRPRMWFAETALDQLLGLDPAAESVFAVVPLPGDPVRPAPSPPAPEVRVSEVERSAEVVRWSRVERVHRAAVVEERAPEPKAIDAAAVEVPPPSATSLVLPSAGRLDVDLATVLRNRKSSFGRFAAAPQLSGKAFATVLAAADRHLVLHPELRSPGSRATRIVTVAQHVDAIPPGVYDYVADDHTLRGRGPASGFQQYYALSNYNLEQAAALLAIVARPHSFIEAGGARAYRLINAEVGAIAQNIYLAAAALGVGCGAALGFDNAALAPHLGLSGTDSWPMLLLMVGNEREGEADLFCSLTGSDVASEERP
jgi:SagB-type dehydrogenase family enzyme